jgi:integrase
MAASRSLLEPRGSGKDLAPGARVLGLHDVRLHDFRRTLSTHLYRATKDEYLVKRCINHVNPSVTAIYVRITQEVVAKALQAQADRFWALTVKPAPVAIPAPAQGALAPLAFC